jgi:hypothetical protein
MNLRPYGPGMPSDAISMRYGFDGNENDEVMFLHQKHTKLGVRATFAVNTHYPEVFGGYFENRALFELVDASLRNLGLSPVLSDHYSQSSECVVPVEGVGQLIVYENYALVRDDGVQAGILLIWRFSAGGGGNYYSDNVIFDFVLPQLIMDDLADDVERRCSLSNVRFTRYPPVTASSSPWRGRSALRRWWAWLAARRRK